MKLKIAKKVLKPFTGKDGEEREYFWYIGKRADGMAVRFGSSDGSHEIGDDEDYFLEEKTFQNGGKGFAEIVLDGEE